MPFVQILLCGTSFILGVLGESFKVELEDIWTRGKIFQDGLHGRKAIAITIREIRNELEKIYKERKSWNGAKGPFGEPAIRRRELILIKQQILY